MKQKLFILGIVLVLLTACASVTTVKTTTEKPTTEKTETQVTEVVKPATDLVPAFRIMEQQGLRHTKPPVIKGTVMNIGNATGNAKITGRIYYAGVVAYESSTIVENIAPEQIKNFTIEINQSVQWTSYTAVAEVSN